MALVRMSNKLAEEIIQEDGVNDKLKEAMRTLLTQVPDITHDWELQSAVFKVLFDHAHQSGVREGRRGY